MTDQLELAFWKGAWAELWRNRTERGHSAGCLCHGCIEARAVLVEAKLLWEFEKKLEELDEDR